MAQATYPYLDLTVLPEIRSHVIAPNAAVLFDPSFTYVLWANGEGADFIGTPTVRRAIEGEVKLNPAMRRQIMVAADRLDQEDVSTAILRLKRGFKTRLLGCNLRRVVLPQGEEAILLLTESLHTPGYSQTDMAAKAVSCLDGYSHASAILDGSGKLIAASEHFETLDVDRDALAAMAIENNAESDRLVKRPIKTAMGDVPAGMARLTDNPAIHLMVIANFEDDVATTDASSQPVKADVDHAEDADKQAAEVEASADDGPTVGAFSNKRTGPKAGALGRWYYKAPRDDEKTEEDATTSQPDEGAEAEGKRSDERLADTADETDAASSALAQAGLVQTAEHTPLDGNGSNFSSAKDEDRDQTDLGFGSHDDSPEDAGDGFRFTSQAKPVRFVWEIDTDNVFRATSSELSETVGPASGNIDGLTWDEVATSRGLENGPEIAALLSKQDTWSGKTVMWPVEGTDLRIPIDLAGLPSYDRSRVFDGFSGFGILRTADVVVDPDALGLSFGAAHKEPQAQEDDGEGGSENNVEEQADDAQDQRTDENKVVDLSSLRENRSGRALSSGEQKAFEEIAEKLADSPEAKADTAPDDKADTRVSDFIPSAFAAGRSSRNTTSAQSDTSGTDDTANAKGDENRSSTVITPDHDVDTSILARLPIPVLVYRANELLFGNDEFFDLTGYDALQSLAHAGGVEALFGAGSSLESQSQAHVYHRDGRRLDVQAHIQRVPWDDDKAMLLTLRHDDRDTPSVFDDNYDGVLPDENGALDNAHDSTAHVNDEAPEPPQRPALRLLKNDNGEGTAALKDGEASPTQEAFGGLEADDLRSIIDTATDGVLILSDEGIVRAMNRSAEALFDRSPDDISGQSLTKLLAPESHRSALDYLSGVSGTGVASILNDGREVIGRTAKGGLIPLFITIGRLEKTDACCAVLRDITHWKKAEEDLVTARAQAERANEQKTEFLAKISHEIRTPLNAIIGFSDMMIEERLGKIDNDRYRGYLRDIHKSGNHVLELINDLLDISKIEAGKMDLEFDACDLNMVVSETVAMSQPDANKQRVIIRTSLSTAVPKVVADLRSLKQIVLNLVSNSIKFTKSGGQVIVSTVYEQSGEVVMRVRDTGVGMSETDLNRALRPFEQVKVSGVSSTLGTGLGLPLTKAMVEGNRAHFHIESTPDEGTLVEIHFPSQRVLADR
ncbi:MAG: PAS domain-containing sensor histidine kinase [Pseudomonadota bacterium]